FCNSSIRPTRPIGLSRVARSPGVSPGLRRLLAPSVGITPGAMALSRMPKPAHSVASDMVIVWTADLLIADGTTYRPPLGIQVTTIDTTLPLWPPAIQRLPTACVT